MFVSKDVSRGVKVRRAGLEVDLWVSKIPLYLILLLDIIVLAV